MAQGIHLNQRTNSVDQTRYGNRSGRLKACGSGASDFATIEQQSGFNGTVQRTADATSSHRLAQQRTWAERMAPGDVRVLGDPGDGGRTRPDVRSASPLHSAGAVVQRSAALRKLLVCAALVMTSAPLQVNAEETAPATPTRFTWALKALPVVTRTQREPIPVSVVVGPVAATGITVLQAALVERNTRQPLARAGMRLCRTAAIDCAGQTLDLPAHSSAQLWLWGGDGIGTFEGNVTLAAKERPEGDTVAMTVNSSTVGRKTLGVIAIFVSVAMTWLLTVVVRNRSNRKQLLLPVAIALRTQKYLRMLVNDCAAPVPVPNIVRRLADVENELSLPVLTANGLPSQVPGLGPGMGGPALDAYRKHVQAQSDWLQALAIIVREGLQPAWCAWSQATNLPAQQQWAGAISEMDMLALAAAAPSADAVRLALRNIVSQVNAAGAKAMPEAPVRSPDTVGTPEQLMLQIAGLGAAGWVFLLLATTLGGAYILVLGPSGAGFGTVADFAQCLLWGAGLPAGAQLMQSTTGSIAASFGVPR